MLIAIISDSHDNIPNIDEGLRLCAEAGVAALLHCGDVCAPSVLKYIAEKFPGPIHLVFGNVDGDREKMMAFGLPNVTIHGEQATFELADKRIGMVHYPDQARIMAESGQHDFVFYGHNHKPWVETVGKARLINPGTLAGLFAKPTFALYDTATGVLTLKLLYHETV
ncbi:MAG: metallophosphoesterase [Patescibacteria group bacterium]